MDQRNYFQNELHLFSSSISPPHIKDWNLTCTTFPFLLSNSHLFHSYFNVLNCNFFSFPTYANVRLPAKSWKYFTVERVKEGMPAANLLGGLLCLSHVHKELHNSQCRETTPCIIFIRYILVTNILKSICVFPSFS